MMNRNTPSNMHVQNLLANDKLDEKQLSQIIDLEKNYVIMQYEAIL